MTDVEVFYDESTFGNLAHDFMLIASLWLVVAAFYMAMAIGLPRLGALIPTWTIEHWLQSH